MDSLTVDHTYGGALFEVAKERGKIVEIGDEIKEIRKIFKDNPLLKRLFMVPTVSALHKRDAAQKIFEGRISTELLNFIYILIDKNRIHSWDAICNYYDKLIWENDGLIKGVVYSAAQIDKDRLEALEEKTGEAIDKKVRLENRVDKSLIGGLRIYADGKLIDASVKTRLEKMKQRIRS